jgi:hypothetical protein
MKTQSRFLAHVAIVCFTVSLICCVSGKAQNTTFTYQGHVLTNGVGFAGTGQFEFALVTSANTNSTATAVASITAGGGPVSAITIISPGNGYVTAPAVTISGGGGSGATATAIIGGGGAPNQVSSIMINNPGSNYTSVPTVTIAPPPVGIGYTTYWNNDGNGLAGSGVNGVSGLQQPASAVNVGVTNGLFTVILGNAQLINMTAIPAALFSSQPNLQLQIWFNDGVHGLSPVSPLQTLTPTPNAVMALNASNLLGTLPASQISGAVTLSQLPAVVITNGASGVTISGTFSGDGASLSNLNAATVGGEGAWNFWQLGGNNVGSGQFLGSTNNRAMEIWAGAARALRLEPGGFTGAPNVIGGSLVNYAAPGVTGAVIAGGGTTNAGGAIYSNSVFADQSVVGGGMGNSIQTGAIQSFLGGGFENFVQANANDSVLGGGVQNTIQANASYSVLGGGGGNYIEINSQNSVLVGGGGNFILSNVDHSFLGGGEGNYIFPNAGHSVVDGGYQNAAKSNYSTVGGGSHNIAGGTGAFVGGGLSNNAVFDGAVVGGGDYNNNSGYYSTISGGFGNSAGGLDENGSVISYTTVSGGESNIVSGYFSTIGGGFGNSASGSPGNLGVFNVDGFATVAGGQDNGAIADYSTVAGGFGNIASGHGAFVGGGGVGDVDFSEEGNTASGTDSVVTGGSDNQATGSYATIPGGYGNVASADGSFAAGGYAHASHAASFVWGDGSREADSQGSDTFSVLATGGVWMFTGPYPAGVKLAPGASAWTTLSDRNAKKNVEPVDYQSILDKLAKVPVDQWNYNWEKDSDVPNIGPMAQDFKAAFFPGRDDKGITTLEFDGVELAAIKGLNQKVDEKEAKIQAQASEIAQLKARLDKLEALFEQSARGQQK